MHVNQNTRFGETRKRISGIEHYKKETFQNMLSNDKTNWFCKQKKKMLKGIFQWCVTFYKYTQKKTPI